MLAPKMILPKGLLGLLSIALIAACSPESPKLKEQPTGKRESVKDVDETAKFNPKVDILFVIDDSGSMSTHQDNLSRNIPLFTAAIQANTILDYHIAVTSSTFNNGNPQHCMTGIARACGQGVLHGGISGINYIERSTPNGIAVLAQNMKIGTSGDSSERFFAPVRAALSQPLVDGLNKGFYRPDAALVVIFVTDAEDQSMNFGPDDYERFLVGLKKGDASRALTYGVIIGSTDGSGCARDESTLPTRIEKAITNMGGSQFGLCDADFGTKIANLAYDLVQKVSKVMYLTRAPDPSTISVTFGTQTIPNDLDEGWTYDPVRNALIFGDKLELTKQPDGTELEVTFIAAQYE